MTKRLIAKSAPNSVTKTGLKSKIAAPPERQKIAKAHSERVGGWTGKIIAAKAG